MMPLKKGNIINNKKFKYEDIFQRNIGIITSTDQYRLKNSTISIAGVGGDGGLIAETFARLGVGAIKIADPERFEVSNLNRQNGSGLKSIGRHKVDVIADIIADINPECNLSVYREGVNSENISDFISGSDIVIDESEFTQHEIAALLTREAKENKIPVLTGLNVGYGVFVFAFTEESVSFEKYFGLGERKTIKEISEQKVKIQKWCPWIPGYIPLGVFKSVSEEGASVPGLSPSVSLVSSTVTTEAMLYLLGKRKLIGVPKYIWIDLYHRKIKIRRANSLMFYISIISIYLRTLKVKRP